MGSHFACFLSFTSIKLAERTVSLAILAKNKTKQGVPLVALPREKDNKPLGISPRFQGRSSMKPESCGPSLPTSPGRVAAPLSPVPALIWRRRTGKDHIVTNEFKKNLSINL